MQNCFYVIYVIFIVIHFPFLAHSGEPVILANSEFISIHINGSFEISEVSKEHEGIYQCIVSNGVGSELKKDINIKVIGEFNKYVNDKLLMFSLNALFLTFYINCTSMNLSR